MHRNGIASSDGEPVTNTIHLSRKHFDLQWRKRNFNCERQQLLFMEHRGNDRDHHCFACINIHLYCYCDRC